MDPLSFKDLKHDLGEEIMQVSGCKATSRDSAVLDASTHFGAFHETDKGQMPRVPVQLEAFSKPCKLKARSCPTAAGNVSHSASKFLAGWSMSSGSVWRGYPELVQ